MQNQNSRKERKERIEDIDGRDPGSSSLRSLCSFAAIIGFALCLLGLADAPTCVNPRSSAVRPFGLSASLREIFSDAAD